MNFNKTQAPAKKKNGYQMPEKFDEGFVLKDGFKANWTLGKPIGQGGFGLIYLGEKLNSNYFCFLFPNHVGN